MTLECWFEFASSYSYPAVMRVEERAAARRVPLVWRPFLLGPIFQDQGWNDSPFNLNPLRGRYMWRDLERICQREGLPFRRTSVFPRNGLLAARVACRFAAEDWLPTFVRAVFRANFADDLDIANPEILAVCLAEAGVEPEPRLAAAQTLEAKALLREQTEEARRLQIFGAPSFVVNGELFWGGDRLEEALDWAAKGGPSADAQR